MKKQIESELKEIAISIISNDYKTDIETLKKQAASLYEKLAVLDHIKNNSNEEIIDQKTKKVITEDFSAPKTVVKTPITTLENQKPIVEETIVKLDSTQKKPISTTETSAAESLTAKSPDLLFELEELTAGFENLPEFEPANENSKTQISTEKEIGIPKVNDTSVKTKSSLNETLNKGINIGLNDRLAFVKHLFNNSQDDYTRVISQLNTLESSSGAKNFIEQMVKPEYNNWEGKEAFEERFINIVFSKFDH